MKKIFCFAFIAISLFVLASCGGGRTYEIALVTDVGNIDDKSFNEGAWNGVKEYALANGKTFNYFRPVEDSKEARIASIKTAIEKGAKIVVCPGFLFEDSVFEVQDEYPNIAFLILDGQPHSTDYTDYTIKSNVHSIFYQEEQSGYLAGYAAVMEGYRKLGFLGGMAVPAVIRFGYGYVQGAEQAAKDLNLEDGAITMNHGYTGGFAPSPDIKTKMDGWYSDGTEVIFSCGGGIYLSVTAAAEEASKKVIGVDGDQAAESPTIITSAKKELTPSVKMALKSFYNNGMAWDAEHAGVVATLGAADDCVGLPTAASSWRMTNFTVPQYEALFAKLKSGEIVVDNSSDQAVHPVTTKVVVNWTA